MKKAKKLIALLVVSTMVLASTLTVSAAALDVSYVDFSTVGGYVAGKYPQVGGMDDLNAAIAKTVNDFYGKYHAIFGGGVGDSYGFLQMSNYENYAVGSTQIDGIAITTTITDEHDRYAKMEVKVSLYSDPNGVSAVTNTYYIDKENGAEISAEDYEAGLVATDEDTSSQEETTPPAPEGPSAELLATLVPIRMITELGYTVSFNEALKAVEIYSGDELSGIVFIGEDIYVVGDTVYELGVVPELTEGTTYVPVAFFTELCGATVLLDEAGAVVGFEIAE
ncbi:MAG: copper amine oxidase N-terminal domain-containing protein [Clostridiales bacterium]|jgi:hypothetical protein|nr:copper amine oxidase N-terminal domain-containing protein [Clostridiales bacterium]